MKRGVQSRQRSPKEKVVRLKHDSPYFLLSFLASFAIADQLIQGVFVYLKRLKHIRSRGRIGVSSEVSYKSQSVKVILVNDRTILSNEGFYAGIESDGRSLPPTFLNLATLKWSIDLSTLVRIFVAEHGETLSNRLPFVLLASIYRVLRLDLRK